LEKEVEGEGQKKTTAEDAHFCGELDGSETGRSSRKADPNGRRGRLSIGVTVSIKN